MCFECLSTFRRCGVGVRVDLSLWVCIKDGRLDRGYVGRVEVNARLVHVSSDRCIVA